MRVFLPWVAIAIHIYRVSKEIEGEEAVDLLAIIALIEVIT